MCPTDERLLTNEALPNPGDELQAYAEYTAVTGMEYDYNRQVIAETLRVLLEDLRAHKAELKNSL